MITRVLQNVAHGNLLKEKKFVDINSFAPEFWASMKQFADVIRVFPLPHPLHPPLSSISPSALYYDI